MLTIFCGFDPREELGYHVFCSSVIERSSVPVAFVPLASNGMQQGTNQFTLSRFLVPHKMNFKGKAIFMDASDMLMVCDAAEYVELLDELQGAVAVVKHDYKTKHKTKYVGTQMQSPNVDYPRKNWASMMLINCGHDAWSNMAPASILATPMIDLLQLKFIKDEDIVELDSCWNRLVDEDQPVQGAKLLHWTAGSPAFDHYKYSPGAASWWMQYNVAKHPQPISLRA